METHCAVAGVREHAGLSLIAVDFLCLKTQGGETNSAT